MRRKRSRPLLLVVLLIGYTAAARPLWAVDPFLAARQQMVQQHIVGAGITNARVIEAMQATPRHEFLDLPSRRLAYYDMAIPIGHGQTISPPYIVAFMTAQLDPQPTDKVLEIGTGSGYQAAVLSPLVKEVYTIEIVEPLGRRAAQVLQRLNYANVQTKIGDGYLGWDEHAPFDKMIVTCSPENVPQPLVDQLVEGGRMIVPVGERFQQTLCLFTKRDGKLEREPLQATFFVPMTGESEARREVKPDNTRPELAHGGFEETIADTKDPAGWYYLRQGTVTREPQAPEGEHVLVFDNLVPGRSAHALQSFGIDGTQVRQIELSFWVRGQQVRSRRTADQGARVFIEFYNANRAPVGQASVGPWTGDFVWREMSRKVPVPPTARLGVVGIGLFGATGQLAFDQVGIRAEEASR